MEDYFNISKKDSKYSFSIFMSPLSYKLGFLGENFKDAGKNAENLINEFLKELIKEKKSPSQIYLYNNLDGKNILDEEIPKGELNQLKRDLTSRFPSVKFIIKNSLKKK